MWHINGKTYDLSKFDHPGGPIALALARSPNKDATQLFKSYHPFTTKPEAILKKYEVKTAGSENTISQNEEEMLFDWGKESEFFNEVKQVVEPILKQTGTKASLVRWIQLAVLLVITWAVFIPFYRGSWWALFAFPVLLWFSGVNIFHDACHFALSTNWKVNFLCSYLFPWFTSPFTWYHQHVIGHHVYTNIYKKDPDMHHGTYLWKYHSKQRWYNWYRYQKYYLLFIWVNTMMSVAFLVDFFFVLRGSYHRVVKMMPVSNRRKALHYIGRFITFATIYIWPFFNSNLTWTKAFIWSTIPYAIIGYSFALCAQLNHVNGENQDQFNRDWYKHQVITSHTFAPQSLFWFFFSGGLNLQIEHHLFPGVNHWHLRKIQPYVRAVCEKHGVFYNCSETGWEAIVKHLEHIDRMAMSGKQTERG